MKCRNCGAELIEDSMLCRSCGLVMPGPKRDGGEHKEVAEA